MEAPYKLQGAAKYYKLLKKRSYYHHSFGGGYGLGVFGIADFFIYVLTGLLNNGQFGLQHILNSVAASSLALVYTR